MSDDHENDPHQLEYPKMDRRKENQMNAHIIADMLRIENITTELREFKVDTKNRLDKIDTKFDKVTWITISTLLSILGAIAVWVIKAVIG